MSLDAPHARGIGLPSNVQVSAPDVDDYSMTTRCPRCHRTLAAVGTPRVPSEIVVDDALALTLQDDGIERLPVFGWKCERHRDDVVLPAPFEIAPDTYEPVDAKLDTQRTVLAVPAPILSENQ